MRINFLILFLSFFTFYSHAQYSVIAEGLNAPVGIQTDVFGNAWVAETGTGNNDGQISVIKRNGDRVVVLKDLPSFYDPNNEDVTGPWRTFDLGHKKIAIVVGEGPTSDFGRILIFDFNGFRIGHTRPLTVSDATKSIDISSFALSIEGVQNSNPFSMATDHWGNMYVADAGANRVFKINKRTGKISTFAEIPPFPNPLPFGPPFVDAVPTKIISKGFNSFYLAQLTGFPFAPGSARIYEIDFKGRVTTFSTGLTMITDIARDERSGSFYALQFGSFGFTPFPGFQPNSAKIIRINRAGGFKHVIAENFGPAVGLGLDGKGNILVTELGGRVLKFSDAVHRVVNTEQLESPMLNNSTEQPQLQAYPNPAREHLTVEWDSKTLTPNGTLQLIDVTGKTIFEQHNLPDYGRQRIDLNNLNAGIYMLRFNDEKSSMIKKIIVK